MWIEKENEHIMNWLITGTLKVRGCAVAVQSEQAHPNVNGILCNHILNIKKCAVVYGSDYRLKSAWDNWSSFFLHHRKLTF